ncbi:hypothetical protein LSPH24S_04449 [Lysinibacillus sphaericus]
MRSAKNEKNSKNFTDTITSDGKFTAQNAGTTGKVIATLGTKSQVATVTVAKPALFKDIPIITYTLKRLNI